MVTFLILCEYEDCARGLSAQLLAVSRGHGTALQQQLGLPTVANLCVIDPRKSFVSWHIDATWLNDDEDEQEKRRDQEDETKKTG